MLLKAHHNALALRNGSVSIHNSAVGAAANSFGGGSEAAEQPTQQQQQSQYAAADACDLDKRSFYSCLQEKNGDVGSCQFLFEALQSCQQNKAQSQFA
jgi:hypothetical protein